MLLAAGALLAVLALPAPAGAANFIPPGNSGVDQYRESIPDAGGSGTVPRHRGGRHNAAVSPGTRSQLNALGSEGRRPAEAADTTAPAGVGETSAKAGRKQATDQPAGALSGSTTVEDTGSGDSPLSTLTRVLTTGSGSGKGLGVALPLLLAAGVFMAAGLVLRRRRSG
jgi:hypothetical protein